MKTSSLKVDASLQQVWAAKETVRQAVENLPVADVLHAIHLRVTKDWRWHKLNYVAYPVRTRNADQRFVAETRAKFKAQRGRKS